MSPRDEERDAWLAQALRHAPDADADAPPALSDTILRAARAAARPPAAPSRPATVGLLQWLASAWGWLARPPVAAGFASVVVATLVGVMWWDPPFDQTLPRAPEVVSSTPQARAEAAPPAAVAAGPAAPEVQAAAAEAAVPKLADASRESTARSRLADKRQAEKSARASRPADEPTRQRSEAGATQAVAAAAPAPAAKAAAESSGQVAADTSAPPRNDLRALQGGAGPALAKARSAEGGDATLAALRARIAQQPARWRWQRGPGAPEPMNAAVQGWLAELDARVASRWQANTDNMARAPAGSLRLFRDGVLQATLGFSGSAVWIATPGASASATSIAPMAESTAESLRKALDEAAP